MVLWTVVPPNDFHTFSSFRMYKSAQIFANGQALPGTIWIPLTLSMSFSGLKVVVLCGVLCTMLR